MCICISMHVYFGVYVFKCVSMHVSYSVYVYADAYTDIYG